MGKPTGFLEFARAVNPSVEPLERIRNFQEFHPMLNREMRMTQGARCMECGVPFCQSGISIGGAVSGCPLHNLIPEWNDMLYRGNWPHALARLLKTNNFPEFTGRVCPALCEAACTCGLYGDPVTVRENELAIIEDGFSSGHIVPRPPRTRSGNRVAVVGSGPAGLTVADTLNHRGHAVTVFERADRVGGLLMYGIPNMKLDKGVVERRVELMRREGVVFQTGADVGNTVAAEEILEGFDAVVLCCGAKNPRDLKVENRHARGVHFAVDYLTEATSALLDGRQPEITAQGRNVVIVGGGDTGNDCCGTAIRQGAKSVVQLEMMPEPPKKRAENNPWPEWPRVCKTDYGQQEAIAVFGGDPRRYKTTVRSLLTDEAGNLKGVTTVRLESHFDEKAGRRTMREIAGTEETLPAELLLIAAGFLGAQAYVADAFKVARNARTNVDTPPDGYLTNVPGVFAAGDMRRGQSLVVWAITEGRAAARAVDRFLMGYTNLV